MSAPFFMPANNFLGEGAIDDAVKQIVDLGFKKAFLVTDKPLASLGHAQAIADKLAAHDIATTIFDETKPNPTVGNVNAGLALLQQAGADCVISLGGGSPHDCAKAIALLATNGGVIKDYEGLDQSKKPALPMIAINTT
ncbi:iron-containing alcohol dehydrogenase, partial [Snodgrassella sp. CFCC 13594]|uniref:iron-containing alcohol dehydrogenase n=1 Tax=Snodgrassella sp. CFCC 13594 TaxID=1775559 RepID=UPI0012E932E9